MVRTKGPLLSLAATGSLNKILTASKTQNRSYTKKHTKPTITHTDAQVSARACLRFLAKNWDPWAISSIDKWTLLSHQTGLNPYNSYLQYNLNRWFQFLAPSAFWPADDTLQPATLWRFGADIAIRTVNLYIACQNVNANWGVCWHRYEGGGFNPNHDTARELQQHNSTGYEYWRDYPPGPGYYLYRVIPFSLGGVWGTYFTSKFVVIPPY